MLPPLTFAAMVALWWGRSCLFKIPAYLLPGPGAVFSRIVTDAGLLWTHSQVTLIEILFGFGLTIVTCDSARPADRAFRAREAGRVSADHADAARAEDRGRAAIPRLARLRDRIEVPAYGADDILSAAPREHQWAS
jgi:hypothetical protein